MKRLDEPVDSLKYKQPRGGTEEKQESTLLDLGKPAVFDLKDFPETHSGEPTECIMIYSGSDRPVLIVSDLNDKMFYTFDLIPASDYLEGKLLWT